MSLVHGLSPHLELRVSRSDAPIEKVLGYARRIAVVGLSDRPNRTSFGVAAVLQRQGYEIVPVNPTIEEALGEKAYASLAEVPGRIDIVDVFRREEHLVGVAEEAVARGDVGAVWMQLGLRSREAKRIVEAAGLDYVEDACLKVEVASRARDMELPPAA